MTTELMRAIDTAKNYRSDVPVMQKRVLAPSVGSAGECPLCISKKPVLRPTRYTGISLCHGCIRLLQSCYGDKWQDHIISNIEQAWKVYDLRQKKS